MSKHLIIPGDFLKNAGIVGLYYMLKEYNIGILEGREYGIKEQGSTEYGFEPYESGLWLDEDFIENADWTDIFFKACVKYYRDSTVYARVLDNINVIIDKIDNDVWQENSANKDMLKFISDKLLSNSYKSGFDNIKNDIENAYIYENLQKEKLSFKLDACELKRRLEELNIFLKQPLCEETFVMKSVIFNYINCFWEGKSFLYIPNQKKNMRELFEQDFIKPFKDYVKKQHIKDKDICIDCGKILESNDRVSIAFLKDMADDLDKKKSAFWNCKVDAFLCPVCAFVYALSPLGFYLMGNRFLFINTDQNIQELLEVNRKDGIMQDVEREDGERYTSWISRTLNLLLKMKTEELGNIQIITRGRDESERYTFDIINKNILAILNDEKVRAGLDVLSKYPYIKKGTEYINIHETVILNILRYRNQYPLLNILLRQSMDVKTYLLDAYWVYDIQIRVSLLKKDNEDKNKIGGAIVNRYKVRECGYELRNKLLAAKGTSDDSRIRGTVYRLLNAVAVGDVSHFMEIIMRIYCSVNLTVPDAFIECLDNREKFREYGYAFLMGLEGSHYEKKEEKVND